jgi:hypothetical protein
MAQSPVVLHLLTGGGENNWATKVSPEKRLDFLD